MKKLISLMLALCLMLSLVSIASADVPSDWEPFAERVKITVPVYDRSKVGYPAVDNNYWTQWIQKEFGDKYNIDVQYVAIPRGDVMTKYSLLIAAGDTPTIMMEYDYPKVAQWANDGAMAEINLDDLWGEMIPYSRKSRSATVTLSDMWAGRYGRRDECI